MSLEQFPEEVLHETTIIIEDAGNSTAHYIDAVVLS